MTDAELREIEERAALATPGPWELEEEGGISASFGSVAFVQPHGNVNTIARTGETFSHDDGRFISAARADVPALVAEVRRLRTELQATEELFNRLAHDSDACRMGAEGERAAILADILPAISSLREREFLERAIRSRGADASLPPDRLLARAYRAEAALREIARVGEERTPDLAPSSAIGRLQEIARTALAEAGQ